MKPLSGLLLSLPVLASRLLACLLACVPACLPLLFLQEEHDKVHDLFLYSRAHLRPDAPLPPPEALPECPLDCEPLPQLFNWVLPPLAPVLHCSVCLVGAAPHCSISPALHCSVFTV